VRLGDIRSPRRRDGAGAFVDPARPAPITAITACVVLGLAYRFRPAMLMPQVSRTCNSLRAAAPGLGSLSIPMVEAFIYQAAGNRLAAQAGAAEW
jgi:hypothetical protein